MSSVSPLPPRLESSNPRPDITVAIVSHRHSRYLDACLSSIFNTPTRCRVEVGLVDNVGEPVIAELVRTRFPQVHLIVNDRPKGFSQNNNMVLLPSTARYQFLLNPDTIIQPGSFDALVEFMDAHPDAGACGPKLVYTDGRLQLSCRNFPSLGSVLMRRTPLRVFLRNSKSLQRYTMEDWDHNSSRPVDWLFGAAILIRRETLDQVGGLDEDMFLFSEDVDWCLRCRQAGWEIYYVPESIIVHDFNEEKYNRYFTRARWLHYQSMFRFFCKHWRHCLRW